MYAPLFLNSSAAKPTLRIGLLLDTEVLNACFAEVLDQIARSNFARLELVVFNADAQQPPSSQPIPHRSLIQKVVATIKDKRRRDRLLFTLYERWDSKRNPFPNPLAPLECGEYLKGVDSITVTPITKRFVHRFPEDVIARIREKDLDVLIRFGFNILRGEILNAARYGVWSYHHGDNDEYRGGPAYFWEVYEDNLISGAILQVLTEELDAGKVLCKGFFATRRGSSWHRNQVRPFWGAGTFMIQKLQELHQCGWQQLQSEMVPPQPYRGKTRIYTVPTNRQMFKWLGPLLVRTGARQAARRVRSRRMPHWMLGVRVDDRSRTDAPAGDLNGFQWLQSPRGHFYADPFLIEQLGKTWVFFEDFDYNAQKGVISCAEVLRDGNLSNPTVALEAPYHLSYPCLVRDEGQMYMIPESLDSKTVQLYRCERFPNVWEPVKVLLEAPAVDTTVWKADGLYWFFVTLVEPRGGAVQLWIFYSHTLTGEWTSHRQNPISTDARYSRGAGAIFQRRGKLIRPSQDCTGEFSYGRAIFFNEIVALNCDEYLERPCGTIDAGGMAHMIGTHTYSRSGDVEVIDGCALLPVRDVV